MSIGRFPKRGSGPKKPLHTGNELAREFGITPMLLGRLLRNYHGPKHVRVMRNEFEHKTFFDADAVRAWWRALPEDVKNESA